MWSPLSARPQTRMLLRITHYCAANLKFLAHTDACTAAVCGVVRTHRSRYCDRHWMLMDDTSFHFSMNHLILKIKDVCMSNDLFFFFCCCAWSSFIYILLSTARLFILLFFFFITFGAHMKICGVCNVRRCRWMINWLAEFVLPSWVNETESNFVEHKANIECFKHSVFFKNQRPRPRS